MKALKKATALLLALLMLFGSMSVVANAALNTATETPLLLQAGSSDMTKKQGNG